MTLLSSDHFALNAANAASRAAFAVGCLFNAPNAATVSVMFVADAAASVSSAASSPGGPSRALPADLTTQPVCGAPSRLISQKLAYNFILSAER